MAQGRVQGVRAVAEVANGRSSARTQTTALELAKGPTVQPTLRTNTRWSPRALPRGGQSARTGAERQLADRPGLGRAHPPGTNRVSRVNYFFRSTTTISAGHRGPVDPPKIPVVVGAVGSVVRSGAPGRRHGEPELSKGLGASRRLVPGGGGQAVVRRSREAAGCPRAVHRLRQAWHCPQPVGHGASLCPER